MTVATEVKCACGVEGCERGGKRPNHGTASTYDFHKCRCEFCKEAKKFNEETYMMRRIERGEIEHGKAYSYYRLGCRCGDCRKAENERQRAFRARKKQRQAEGAMQ